MAADGHVVMLDTQNGHNFATNLTIDVMFGNKGEGGGGGGSG